MNRVLYQLSYAAIFRYAEIQLCYYIQGVPICQEKSLYFFFLFWQSYPGGDEYGFYSKKLPVPSGRRWLCGTGISVAGPQPHQHVLRGGRMLSAAGAAAAHQVFSCCQEPSWCADHHGGGAFDGAAGKPAIPGVGLPADAPEFPGAGVSSLQPAVDPREFRRHAAASMAEPTGLFPTLTPPAQRFFYFFVKFFTYSIFCVIVPPAFSGRLFCEKRQSRGSQPPFEDNRKILRKNTVPAFETVLILALVLYGACFGPVLISNGETNHSLKSGLNPRMAIGQRSDGTVLFLLLPAFFGLRYLWNYAAAYEMARPYHAIDTYMEALTPEYICHRPGPAEAGRRNPDGLYPLGSGF